MRSRAWVAPEPFVVLFILCASCLPINYCSVHLAPEGEAFVSLCLLVRGVVFKTKARVWKEAMMNNVFLN